MTNMQFFHHTSPLEESVVLEFLEKKLNTQIDSITSPPEISAEYHKIYIANVNGKDLFLRISRPAIPVIKTRNEVACLLWVKQHIKSCPVPDILAWSDTTEELGYEYVLLSRLPGKDLSTSWRNLTDADFDMLINQVAEICVELAQVPFDKVGGLTIDKSTGHIVPGPIIEETTYEVENLQQHWSEYPEITVDKLQVGGPFSTMADYIIARLRRDLFVLSTHKRCAEINQTMAPAIEEIIDTFTNKVRHVIDARPLVLAHQDLHFGNMLWDESLSGVLDWEFSGITALDQWIRRNTFAGDGDEVIQKAPLRREQLHLAIKERSTKVWEDIQVVPLKDTLNILISLTFWITHCTVTDTQAEDRKVWIQRFNDTLLSYRSSLAELD
ncbi:hypothetical protein INT43_004728 [Umbelopsis isabellina]|uniref:Aminoglycoside phosphotransferase domain-containing protein n=1 Tax=Mortierella isabellina TaxID=91625 RepID=A0A8H7PG53_MORIS|nr:hypothetical protein INT43_004728 [Umbelopsis isabellina]